MAMEEPLPFFLPSATSAAAKQSARDEIGNDIMSINDFLSGMFRQLHDNLDTQQKCILEFLTKPRSDNTPTQEGKRQRSVTMMSKNVRAASKDDMRTRRQSTSPDSMEINDPALGSASSTRIQGSDARYSSSWSVHTKEEPIENETYEILDAWEELRDTGRITGRTTFSASCAPEAAATSGLRTSLLRLLPRRNARMSMTNGSAFRAYHRRSVLESTSAARHFVLHPYGNARMVADIGSVIFVLWDTVMIPLSFFEIPDSPLLVCMAWTTRIFWTMDILLSFVSGYAMKDGFVEMRAHLIAKKYIWTWFPLDVSVVSIDWLDVLFSASWSGYGVTRMTRASRAYRVIRFARLLRLLRMREKVGGLLERFVNEGVVTCLEVVKLIVMMLAGGHFMACFWYAVAVSNSGTNWVNASNFAGKPLYLRYTMSLRWSLSQFSGGMDEVQPENGAEQIYAAFVFILCYWSGAVFVSCLTSSTTQMYLGQFQQSSQLMTLRRFLSQNGISRELELRVYRNAQNALLEYQRHMPEQDVKLLQRVSPQMSEEIHCEMYTPVLVQHPFWKRSTVENPPVMRRVCHCAMSQLSVFEEDVIFNFGEAPSKPKAFIVHQGHLYYTNYEGSTALCAEWQWISEASVWTTWVHRGCLRSRQDSHLYEIDVQTLQDVFMQFRSTGGSQVFHYAQNFVAYLNKANRDGNLVDDLVSGATHPIEHAQMKPETRPSQPSVPIGHDEGTKSLTGSNPSHVAIGASSAKTGIDDERAESAESHPNSRKNLSKSISFTQSCGEDEEDPSPHAENEEERFSL